jgi:hypothetical protein
MRPVALFFGLTTTLNVATCCAPLTRISADQRRNGQVAGACDTVYGSEDWGSSPSERAQGLAPTEGDGEQGSNTRVVRIVTGAALSPSG